MSSRLCAEGVRETQMQPQHMSSQLLKRPKSKTLPVVIKLRSPSQRGCEGKRAFILPLEFKTTLEAGLCDACL
jgi:hypothetical protein